MNLKEENFIMLGQILGCYFHQDWANEFDNDSDAIATIVQEESKDRLKLCVSEIDLLLSKLYTDDDLRKVMVDKIGCYFDPKASGSSYAEWIFKVRYAFERK